ncbi:MAG: hypothetical protein CR986_07015 [Ignavibacteriae bacterium]|nr:MAG: hypothetical protein CR986_07015 [Ignavibacteriota bacterium]
MNHSLIEKVKNFIVGYYKDNTPDTITYHNIEHIKAVVKNIKKIAANSKVPNDELELIIIAGWFHDIGHFEVWNNHENISINFAVEFLQKEDYDSKKIEIIKNCILATKIPHSPKNILEKIICDADILHSGTDKFFTESEKLKIEKEKRSNSKISRRNWLINSIEFLEQNKFFTDYAKLKFTDKKLENLQILRKQLDELS